MTLVVSPTKIIGVGTNYRAHALEMGKPLPEEPLLFMKPPSAMIPPGAAIVRPPGYARVDYEGELAVVIGKRARRVTRERALEYVAGYTCLNDVTVRDLQKKDVQFTRAKGFDSFAPVGPRVSADLDPSRLRIETRVNGEVRQSSSTSDLISTGTPSGVGNLSPGDRVEIEIEGIGILANPVIAPEEGESTP